MQRQGTAWVASLRYRQPQYEEMRGLRRVTLNGNTLIGDRGAAALAQELAEDLWIKGQKVSDRKFVCRIGVLLRSSVSVVC